MAWSLDLRTAILIGALATWCTGALLLLSWRSLPTSVRPSMRWWLVGTALHPLGLTLVASEGWLPDWLCVPLAATLIAGALSCLAIALRSFYGLPERRRRLVVVTALVSLGAVWFTAIQPDLQLRVLSLQLLLAVLLGSSARAVYRQDGPRGRVPRLVALMFALATVLALLRAAQAASGVDVVAPLLATSLVTGIGVLSLALLPVLASTGFLLMCTERSQEQLERTARMDHLTGIYNRRAIEDLAARAISASRRHGVPLAVLVVDVDHFKHVNDDFGHECGDQVLVEAVRRMRLIMRSEDLVGRQGGEEFVAVMPDMDLGSAHAAAERLRRSFAEKPLLVHDGEAAIELRLTLSVGVAALEPGDQQFSHLLRRADRAMYAAKAAGRNRVMLDVAPP